MNIQDTGIDIVVINDNDNIAIQACLDGIIRNTPAPYDLIVLDQNSKDGSREWLIESQIASHLILNKVNTGMCMAINQGIRSGKYPWIALVDSHIEIQDKEWVDKIWNYTIDHHIGFIEAKVKKEEGKEGYVGMSYCFIRRACWNEIGILDRKYPIGGDLDWIARFEWQTYWRPAYCSDINVKVISDSKNNEINLSHQIKKRDDILMFKYTQEFLKDTLFKYSDRVKNLG